jgi:hypothetical protein
MKVKTTPTTQPAEIHPMDLHAEAIDIQLRTVLFILAVFRGIAPAFTTSAKCSKSTALEAEADELSAVLWPKTQATLIKVRKQLRGLQRRAGYAKWRNGKASRREISNENRSLERQILACVHQLEEEVYWLVIPLIREAARRSPKTVFDFMQKMQGEIRFTKD